MSKVYSVIQRKSFSKFSLKSRERVFYTDMITFVPLKQTNIFRVSSLFEFGSNLMMKK